VRRCSVLFLSPALPPAASGNARQAARLKQSLAGAGITVRLAAAGDPTVTLLAIARRFHPDLIWGLHLFRSGSAAARLAKALRIPYGLTVTGTDINVTLPRASARRRAALAGAGLIVIPDETFRAPLRRGLGGGKNGPRIACIPPAFAVLPGLRRRAAGKAPVILWLGGLRAVKDPGWALEAFARVQKKIPAAQFHFAGPLLQPAAAAPVLAAARDPGSGVKYLGAKSWPAAQRLIARAALVTNTSHAEALPHALGEALRLGTPVVARDIPGNRPLLRPRGPGIPVSSPETWARQVIRILENPRRHPPHVSASRFNPAREARDYAALFETLLRRFTPIRGASSTSRSNPR
jgi:glycosyltransferase involved in cell wall biosynthesis